MTLIPWGNKRESGSRELGPVNALRTEMDRLFDSFFREPFGMLSHPSSVWSGGMSWPSVDVAETDKDLTVRAELPGIDPKQIDLSVSGNELVISGEKKEETEKKDKDFYHRESFYGSFRRVVPLPDGVDTEKVNADYNNGVLTIKLEKSPTAQPKKIQVKRS